MGKSNFVIIFFFSILAETRVLFHIIISYFCAPKLEIGQASGICRRWPQLTPPFYLTFFFFFFRIRAECILIVILILINNTFV